jgi:DNA (cytosine-5)-methyltransferase 1
MAISKKKVSKKIKAISLFSGCGGTDLALQKAGYSIVWANDVWETACETYKSNLKSPKIECGDISSFTSFPQAELLVGCYPCQGYTQGGKRDWDDPVNFLYRQFDRVLRTVKPAAFIVENVIGMTFGANKERLENQLVRYRSAGYQVKCEVLNAKDYGVAQNRRRVLLVGVHSDLPFEYIFPTPTHGPEGKKPYVTQREALRGFERWPKGEYNEEEMHWYYLSRRRRHDWNEPSPCIVGHWRHVPLHPLSPPLVRISTDEWRFSTKGRSRRLSYKECAALQGFPADYDWGHGTVRDKFQMIGNAVPPPLFSAMLSSMASLW